MTGYFKGLLLAGGVIVFGAGAGGYAAAPVVSAIPDVIIGDLEESTGEVDANRFLFPNAFRFDDFVIDADTAEADLSWSFGESSNGLGAAQYLINGKSAINQGDVAILEDEANGHAKAVAPGEEFDIRLGTETASFRDIVLSPLPDQAVYPDPSTTETEAAFLGKVIRYYVSDGTNVSYNDAFVRTVDDEFDSTIPGVVTYVEENRQAEFGSGNWHNQGLAWEAVSAQVTQDTLAITVQPTQGKSRIFGWRNATMLGYDSVGPDRFVRGKFYVYTDVPILAPLNQVPNFRLGLMNEDAVRASAHFELSATGYSDPGYEPFYASLNDPEAEMTANWLRPADTQISPTPSLYRIDFDPVDVPASQGSSIGAFFESYAVSDPANGSLFLTEIVLGSYNLPGIAGELEWAYHRQNGLGEAALQGGAKVMYGGGFNHEANLVPGHLQDFYFEGYEPGGYFTLEDEGPNGLVGDTDAVGTDVFGVGIFSLESANNVDKLRIEPGRLYHARFYATAPVPTDSDDPAVESQGQVRFRFQTVASRVSYLLEILTASVGSLEGQDTPNADEIATQALPGIGSENPDVDPTLDTDGEDGGWYSVLVPSPMDVGGIRNDVETLFDTVENSFFFLSSAPGSGDTRDSVRDVALGVDMIQAPAQVVTSFNPEYILARPNRAVVRLSAVEVYSYPAIDDGGFDPTPATVGTTNR